MFDPDVIRRKLNELRGRDRRLKVFGATAHYHELNPRLPEAELSAFEAAHGIRLPEHYRTYLVALGNGGAGPYYGVFPFGEQDDGVSWEDGDLVGDIAAPFRHQAAWNATPGLWQQEPDWSVERSQDEEDRVVEAWDEILQREYWAPSIMNGAIPICHIGCALRHWLVVSGEHGGEMWADHRAEQAGIWPLTDAAGRILTFATWYTSWLDEALGKARGPIRSWLARLSGR